MSAQTVPLSDQILRRVRILLVDDMPQVLHDLRQLLELTGLFEIVAEASSGADAVRLSGELSPQVVVMDLEMPGMGGIEATRQIKSRQLAPRVVILSVSAGSSEIERARAAGADAYITKGTSYEILVNTILSGDGSLYSHDPN